jgi:cytochrome P450
MLDLAASPHLTSYLTTMRNEVVSEVEAEKGVWTKAALIRMVSLDSCLRESMRLWGFVSRGILKEVIAKDGVTLPCGMHLKKGTKVGIHAYPVHHDEDLYPNASEFNAMRFCTVDEERPADDYSEKVAGSGKKKGTSLVTTSSHFMAFSHGRHAWYGVSQLLNYLLN